EDESWVEAMQEELLQFKLQQVWVLVDLPNGAKVIGTKWVYRNKKLEGFLKRRNSVLTDSEDEEPEAQGRKSQADPQDSLIQGLITPPTTKAHASGEEQEEDISPNT
ncbi:hypothetical protein Tco_0541675, partial [Tanacetum coccineum]